MFSLIFTRSFTFLSLCFSSLYISSPRSARAESIESAILTNNLPFNSIVKNKIMSELKQICKCNVYYLYNTRLTIQDITEIG